MATVLFTVVGTAFGGPLGGAIGGLLSRQVDQSLFGSGAREGPRLKELSVTTSSYGQPMPRIFGRMRVGGTVIWSTELTEHSETQGGKGQSKTTNYSYSASFAVALSSTPVSRIGRIWADGNLLRGNGGDLKVEGEMRLYNGLGNEPVDPLIAADKGGDAPAFRDCAYVVFENLQLGEFGNRIPALTFEVFADEAPEVLLGYLVPQAEVDGVNERIEHVRGFADEGGAIASTLSTIDRVFPLTYRVDHRGLCVSMRHPAPSETPTLPQQLSPLASSDEIERHKQHGVADPREPVALRYYDEQRDYQPGVQRAVGLRQPGRELMIDLPAVLDAASAKQIVNSKAHQAKWRSERVVWRVSEIDPAIGAGSVVRVPENPGNWLVKSWEWFDKGVELTLERIPPSLGMITGSDPGTANTPPDLPAAPTVLAAIEVPNDGFSNVDTAKLFAAVTGRTDNWSGASLFAEQGVSLVPIGSTGSRGAVIGTLAVPLGGSQGLFFEPAATAEISLDGSSADIGAADLNALANGSNRVCVGGEILQYSNAEEVSKGRWRLCGLLRGRGGTEPAAIAGHPLGTTVVFLNDRLVELDPAIVPPEAASRIAAIGRGDTAPVFAMLQNAGISRRPPSPVHPRVVIGPDGAWELCWTRRARGQWRWEALFEIPLIEQEELYSVGFGPANNPHRTWNTTSPSLLLEPTEISTLLADHGPGAIWVRQVGTFAASPALHLAQLD